MKDPEDKVDWLDLKWKKNPFLESLKHPEIKQGIIEDPDRFMKAERAVDAAWEKNR
jgi:hypothetical protein